ncbi:MAG TPA: hypothetical protein PKC30_09660 [Saprospiraceae bacterium]|mgnify:CR=1 FL=1|nr:hypothetical protein [Saprospiraceae bacterium]
MKTNHILVTETSSEVGEAIGELLAEKGHYQIPSSRHPENCNEILTTFIQVLLRPYACVFCKIHSLIFLKA